MHERHQLNRDNRFYQVIICSALQSINAVLAGFSHSQHQDVGFIINLTQLFLQRYYHPSWVSTSPKK